MHVAIMGSTSLVGQTLLRCGLARHTFLRIARSPDYDLHCDLEQYDEPDTREYKCDALVHAAASFAADTMEGYEANELVNGLGALHVARLGKRLGCRHIVYLASVFSVREPENEYFGSYGLSKQHGDENLEQICRQENMTYTSLVLPQVYDSSGAFGVHQPLLLHILTQARDGEPIVLHGQHDRERCFIHADDVAEIILRVIEQEVAGRWMCPGDSYPLSAWAELAYEAAERTGVVTFDSTRPNIRSVWMPSDGGLYDAIGYKPRIAPAEGFRAFFEQQEKS